MKLLILLDYRSQFYSSTRIRGASLDLARLRKGLEQIGYEVSVQHFAEVNLRQNDYRGTLVFYQSSEDPSLFYRDYIEDMLLGFSVQGAILIPDFPLFRAHHNKVFMEIVRNQQLKESLKGLSTQAFGTYEEYKQFASLDSFPVVLKTSGASKSHNVVIAHTKKEADRAARRLSWSPSLFNFFLGGRNYFDRKGFTPISNHRRKFIVQQFVPNLAGDYKIVVYGEKYFVIFRENRPNDFRASGSGILSFPREVPVVVLNYAQQVFGSFETPFISIDLGYDGDACYLFEFQFVMFGQYAVEKSPWHFVRHKDGWMLVEGQTTIEAEFVTAADYFIKTYHTGGVQ